MSGTPRVLMLDHLLSPDYLLDAIFVGLCKALGRENVIEYPYRKFDKWYYPFNRWFIEGLTDDFHHLDNNTVEEMIKEDYFDLAIVGTREDIQNDLVIPNAVFEKKLPVCLIDSGDGKAWSLKPLTKAQLEKLNIIVRFKRELPIATDFAKREFILSLCIIRDSIPSNLRVRHDIKTPKVVFIGTIHGTIRKKMHTMLTGKKWYEAYPVQKFTELPFVGDDYFRKMNEASICLNFSGDWRRYFKILGDSGK